VKVLTPAQWQEARLNDPDNPLNPAPDAVGYQAHRRTYCEVCLLRGVKSTGPLEVHHAIAQNVLTVMVLPELVNHPHNLWTLCDTPHDEFTCHRTLGHNSNFARCNVYFPEMMYQAWCQIHGHEPQDIVNMRLELELKHKRGEKK
jgi:hypothetical protein